MREQNDQKAIHLAAVSESPIRNMRTKLPIDHILKNKQQIHILSEENKSHHHWDIVKTNELMKIMKQNQDLNSNSYTLGKATKVKVLHEEGMKPSLSPEWSDVISKLIQKYSPVLGGSSFDE